MAGSLVPPGQPGDLFYYLLDLVAATVYWIPRRSKIIQRITTRKL